MTLVNVRITVNGEPRELQAPAHHTLLEALRDDLGLTGTKEGCGTGDCGACTVLLNGENITSCLMLAADADGSDIVTVEGIARDGELHPVQSAFVECGALQCGFCTPGFIVSAKALLDRNPDPTVDQIREELAGNLCRCTGYTSIVEAVLRAARDLERERSGVR